MADGSYVPRRRTGVLFTGVGTAGAYQAGVLKALTEAGVKIDVVAGHGAGAMTALCGAIDGGAKLWDPAAGPWTDAGLGRAYGWRPGLRLASAGLLLAGAVLLAPFGLLVVAAATYAASLLCGLMNLPGAAARLIEWYRLLLESLLSPGWIPTIVPRALVLSLIAVLAVLVAAAVRAAWQERSRRRLRGAFWWRLVGAPLESDAPARLVVDTLRRLVRGASNSPRLSWPDIGRRYAEMLTENLGQPGFREVVLAVHDIDARRDIAGAILQPGARRTFDLRRAGSSPREAEAIDMSGAAGGVAVDFLAGAMRLPVVSASHALTFPAESFWRGETHRVCDRPELALRLLEELAAIGVEQVLIVSPAAPASLPHGMLARPSSLRARMGEVVRSVETAALADARALAAARFSGVFVIRPDHNPIGPFDFAPIYDESSDRQRTVAELIDQGYRDAYRQFIEPVVAAGEPAEAQLRQAR